MLRLCAILLLALLLPGCANSGLPQLVAVTANIPPIPPDVELCAQEATARGARLTAKEANRLWNLDRTALAKVNGCFYRLICQYHDVRREIGRVESEPQCIATEEELRKEAVPPNPKARKKLQSP